MKRFLRAACAAVLLLLLIGPIKTLADNVGADDVTAATGTVNGSTAEGPLGGNTQFDVSVVEKYHYLHLQVMDGDDTDRSLTGIHVKVYQAGGQEKTGITDENGRVTFKLDKNPAVQYSLEMGQDMEGFHPYHMDGITLPYKHTGVPERASGNVDPNDPNPNPVPGDPFPVSADEYGKLYLKPLHFPVTYEGGEHGNIKAGKVEYVRYGKSPTAADLQMDIPDEWHVDGWMVNGSSVPEKLSDIRVTEALKLTAHYVRQYLVTYTAGDYGYLDGVTSEYVVAGERPAHVPAPVPMSREYWFVQWKIDAPFSSKSVAPASMTITGDIAFKAVFDVRKHQPVIINTPTEPGTPLPGPGSSAAAPIQTGPVTGPGGAGVSNSGDYGGGSTAENPAPDAAAQTQPSGQETPPLAPGQEGTKPGGPGDHPSAPVSGQPDSNTNTSWLPWLILVSSLFTLVGGLLRLRAIRRTAAGISRQEEGEESPPAESKAVVTEVIAGLICLILWGSCFMSRSSSGYIAVLALCGVVQAVMAVLLIRGEYRLRKKH